MDNIYSLLNLPQNAPREDLKAAFIAWKKTKQQILTNGTRDEQAQASKEISEMTALYKAACGISDAVITPRKSTAKIGSSSIIAARNETIPPPNPQNISPPNATSTSAETDKQKILNIALCLVIVILGGVIFYLYNEKKATPPVVVQKIEPPRSENSNVISSSSSAEKIPEVKPVETKPIVEDRNAGKTPAQRDAIQTLLDFHESITKKSFEQAYNCMSHNLQKQISYEGWTPGFRTTVSSTPTNIKIVSESPDSIILTYDLTAVDNPGGTQTFAGTVTMIKTSAGWKIDDMINRVR